VRSGECACPFCGAALRACSKIYAFRLTTRLPRGLTRSIGAALAGAGIAVSCAGEGVPVYGAPGYDLRGGSGGSAGEAGSGGSGGVVIPKGGAGGGGAKGEGGAAGSAGEGQAGAGGSGDVEGEGGAAGNSAAGHGGAGSGGEGGV